jgi:hypothetical protein
MLATTGDRNRAVDFEHPEQGPPPGMDPLRFAWAWFGRLKRNQDDLLERVAYLEDQMGIRLQAEGASAPQKSEGAHDAGASS